MIGAALLLAFGGAPAEPDQPPAELGSAMRAFADVCLAHPGSAGEARSAAEAAGFSKGQTLANPGGPAPLEGYDKPPLGIMIREQRSGEFGCILLFRHETGVANAAVADAVTALPGLTLKSSGGNAKGWRAKWTPLQAPKGSEVVLTLGYFYGRDSVILSLESKAKK